MVCKKCGHQLINGIDICPFCGEENEVVNDQEEITSNKTAELNDLVDSLGDLKMDVEAPKDEKLEINFDTTDEMNELKDSIKNLNVKIEEKNDTNIFINNSIEQKESTEPVIEDAPFVLSEVKIEPIAIEEPTKLQDNILTEVEETPKESIISEIKEEPKEVKIDLAELKKLPEDELLKEDFIEPEPREVQEKDNVDVESIKIFPDEDLQTESKIKIVDSTKEEPREDITNISSLINELKDVQTEDVKPITDLDLNKPLDKEESPLNKDLNIYSLLDDLKTVKIDGVSPSKQEEPIPQIVEEPKPKASWFENDFLINNNEPRNNREFVNHNLNNILEEQPKNDVSNIIPEEQPIIIPNENNNIKELPKDENKIDELINVKPLDTFKEEIPRLQEPELNLKAFGLEPKKTNEVYINTNLTNPNKNLAPNLNEEVKQNVETKPQKKSNTTFIITFTLLAILCIASAILLAYMLTR